MTTSETGEQPVAEDEGMSPEAAVDIATMRFFQGNKILNQHKITDKVSKKGFIRALMFSLNNNMTDKDVTLTKKNEIELAYVISEILVSRTIMEAHLLMASQEKQKEIEDGKKEME